MIVQRVAEEANLRSKQNEVNIMKAEQRLSTAYRYKGSVYSYDSLPTEGNEIGDVYNVMFPNGTDGANYAWNGSSWDSQSGIFAVDSTVIEGSVNPVSSNGVFFALEQKAPVYHAFELPEEPELPEQPEEPIEPETPETGEEAVTPLAEGDEVTGEESTEGEEQPEEILPPKVYVDYGVGSSTLYGHVRLTDDYMTVSKMADFGIGASAFAAHSIYNQLVEVKATADRTKDWTLFSELSEAVYPAVEGDENILATKVVISQINEKLDDTNTSLDEFKTAVGEQIEELEQNHSADIDNLTESLGTQVEIITDDIALVRKEHSDDISALTTSFDSKLATQKEELEDSLAAVEDALGKQIADNKTASDNAFDEINLTLDEQIENLNTLEQTVLQNQETCDTRFEEVNQTIQEVASGVFKTVEQNDGTVAEVTFNPSAEATALECATGTEYTFTIDTPKAVTATFYVVFRNGYNAFFVWPESVKFSNDIEVEMSSGIDILRFFTIDSGATWYIVHEFSNAHA